MPTPLPKHPIAVRREYLIAAREVATRQPTDESVARLLALTQALFAIVCGEPELELRMVVPDDEPTSN